MDLVGGLGDNVGHPQLDDQHGSQDAHVDLLTDADRHGAAVLHTGFLQRRFAQVIHHKGVVGVGPHFPDFFLILVDGDDFLTGFGQGLDQRRAEPSQPDDAI